MSNLARMRGAKHLPIIQPIYFIHKNIENSSIDVEKKFFSRNCIKSFIFKIL